MLFAIYIQKLRNCIEPNTSRGDFTKKILKLIVTNEQLVDDYSKSSYNGFYDGATQGTGKDKKIIGDKIHACAIKIVGYLDVDESGNKTKVLPKFKAYLKKLQFNTTTKNDLCDSFRCELPNINIDNYLDQLSELLIKVINEAADQKKRGKDIDPPIDDSANTKEGESASTTTNINTDKIEELKDLISELNGGFIELKDKGIELHSPFAHRTDEEQNVKEQEFESIRTDFIEKHNRLRRYYLSFPELRDIFEEMLSLSATLSFEIGFTNNVKNQAIAFQKEKYEKCIDNVWKALNE